MTESRRGRGLPWAGAVVVLGGLFFLDPRGLLPAFILSVAVHELGHGVVLRSLGGRLRGLRAGLGGLWLEVGLLSWPVELAGALGGPIASLLFAGMLEDCWPLGAAVSQCLGLWNLLPLFPLDGGRALSALFTGLGPPGLSAAWERHSSWLLVPAGFGALLWFPRFGPVPLLLTLCLAMRVLKR